MSKLAQLKHSRAYAGDPAFPLFGAIAKLAPKVMKVGGKLLGIGKKVVSTPTGKAVAGAIATGAGFEAGSALLSKRGSSGASGSWGRRRAKGITAAELRGFHRVANLLRKVGMVPRATRTKVKRGR